MKKLTVLLVMLVLTSCSSDNAHLEEDIRVVQTLKDTPETIEQKSSFYIHDDMSPNYVLLSNYPYESLIDWDEETGVNVKDKPELVFEFTQQEAIRGIELQTKNINSILVEVGGKEKIYTINADYQIITFDDVIMSDYLKLIPYETSDESCIIETHITCDLNVDKTTFEVFQSIESDLIEFRQEYSWSNDPIQAMLEFQKVLEDYSIEKIEMMSKDFDATRMKQIEGDFIGSPYRISGKVIAIKDRNNYQELTIETIIDHEMITVYTMNTYQVDDVFKSSCLLINQKNILTFITIQ